MKKMPVTIASFLLLCACSLFISKQAAAAIEFKNAFPDLWFERPIYLTHFPDGSNLLLVAQQDGKIFAFPNNPRVKKSQMVQMFDGNTKHGKIKANGEEGLLGVAISPNFKTNRTVFLHYSAQEPRRGIISKFKVNNDGTLNKKSEKLILQVEQPYANHNGGTITFGPDNYLYIGFGDGGAAGDPKNHGQDLSTLLGTILRIDVSKSTAKKPYTIPKDNPFIKNNKAKPEIYAYGIRNPWRFSFDRKTKQLWVGDVGQNKYEEVSIVPKGGNMGWNIREGKHHFRKGSRRGLIEPVWEYDHSHGASITGGYVYRGKKIPSLQGAYIFADFATSHVWALWYDTKRNRVIKHQRLGEGHTPASFGEDAQGEIYICTYGGGIFKIIDN
ncbi:PQQ-dependent sugar dehydrogenase [Planctomycetota bacterium]|nr:PQQ-dependent sugar dehydrogenase [Planctomycetota bacterium]